MKKRDVVLALVLTLVTCGIYGLYWMASLNNDANTLAERNDRGGAVVVILSIITCGIYAIYWNYQMGKRCYEIQIKNGQTGYDNSVLYLILTLVGLSIVNYCLIQDELNKYIPA